MPKRTPSDLDGEDAVFYIAGLTAETNVVSRLPPGHIHNRRRANQKAAERYDPRKHDPLLIPEELELLSTPKLSRPGIKGPRGPQKNPRIAPIMLMYPPLTKASIMTTTPHYPDRPENWRELVEDQDDSVLDAIMQLVHAIPESELNGRAPREHPAWAEMEAVRNAAWLRLCGLPASSGEDVQAAGYGLAAGAGSAGAAATLQGAASGPVQAAAPPLQGAFMQTLQGAAPFPGFDANSIAPLQPEDCEGLIEADPLWLRRQHEMPVMQFNLAPKGDDDEPLILPATDYALKALQGEKSKAPIPVEKRKRAMPYPWAKLEPGQSFRIPFPQEKKEFDRLYANIRSRCSQVRKEHQKNYHVVLHREEGFFECLRAAD